MSETSKDAEIREAIANIGGFEPTVGDVDFVKVYQMEQQERAQELYEAAVGDGVNFSIKGGDEGEEVFVNVKWLGSIIHTLTEGMLLSGGEGVSPMSTVEVLGQTILAAEKFAGKE